MPTKKTNREEIISVCEEVFHRHGYFNTSMADLAKACGLMKGSFYHYFASKEEIMKAVLLSSQRVLREQVLAFGQNEIASSKERLAIVLSLITAHVSEYRSCLFGNSVLETSLVVPEFQRILREIFQDIQETLAEVYVTKYPLEQADRMAWQTIHQIQGAVMMMKLYDRVDLLQEAKQHIIETF